MDGFNPVLQTGADEAIENIITDVVHGTLTKALLILDTMIIALGDFVLLVLAIAHCPPTIRTLDQTGENLHRAVLPLSAATGYVLLYSVEIRP